MSNWTVWSNRVLVPSSVSGAWLAPCLLVWWWCIMSPDHRMSTSHSIYYARWVRYWRQTDTICMNFCAGCIRVIRFGPKVSQIGSQLNISRTFQVRFQYILPHIDLKSLGFLPFGANLAHFGSKSKTPGVYSSLYPSQSRRRSLP